MYNIFAQQYDRFTSDIPYADRAKYFDTIIVSYCKERGILLDLACGTGSLTMELDTLGYDMIGVDSSYEMLAIAREKAEQSEKELLFLCQKMETLDLYGTIDACVCALDSVNHITSMKSLEKAIARVSLFLSPKGIFVFDANSVYKHQQVLANNCYIYQNDGIYCGWQNFTDSSNLTKITLDFFSPLEDGTYARSSESFSERGYTDKQWRETIEKAGLTLLAVYGDDTFLPPEENAQRWIYVTQKP